MGPITIHNREPAEGVRKSAGTIVLLRPDAEAILTSLSESIKTLKHPEPVEVSIGAVFLHPDDQLNKKKGREQALERMKALSFQPQVVPNQNPEKDDALWVWLEGYDPELSVLYLVEVKIYRDDRKLRVMRALSAQGDV